MSMRILQLPNRGGKTYNALKWLHDRGGGVFVTQNHPEIAHNMIKQFNFQNISVMEIATRTPIAIDDIDARESMITMTFPASLSWKDI